MPLFGEGAIVNTNHPGIFPVRHDSARLVITRRASGELISYACSLCGKPFPLDEEGTPKKTMAELWAAFKAHVENDHPNNQDEADRNR
jgi:hypothetical protein